MISYALNSYTKRFPHEINELPVAYVENKIFHFFEIFKKFIVFSSNICFIFIEFYFIFNKKFLLITDAEVEMQLPFLSNFL